MEHDLDAAPVRVHRIEARQVVDRVQSAFVFVETYTTTTTTTGSVNAIKRLSPSSRATENFF